MTAQHTQHNDDSNTRRQVRVDDLDELMTLAEVAALLRVPEATLRYWRSMRTGPDSFRLGRGVRYRRSAVHHWIHQQEGNHRGPNAA